MPSLAERLIERGVRSPSFHDGSRKMLCPRCSHTRKNRKDPRMTITIDADGAVWNCHHCGWSGGLPQRDSRDRRSRPRPAPARPTRQPGELTPEVLRWFEARGISEAVVRRNGIGFELGVWFSELGRKADPIAFPTAVMASW